MYKATGVFLFPKILFLGVLCDSSAAGGGKFVFGQEWKKA
jgi:hypothetical protein